MSKPRFNLSTNRIQNGTFANVYLLDVASLGLSMADALSPDAFGQQNTGLQARDIVRITASDGRCWAEVTEVTPWGTLVIEPDIAPTSQRRRAQAA